ncbi:MAG: winged helix-turn-helix domain-containing protein [Acidobacteria bacterium]|nr:winged helix-turn-helix domain-containing protein [Acidobacteriota bacterium]
MRVPAFMLRDGFFQLSSEQFDLLILDLMLPGRSGLQVLEAARKQGLRIPVLVLTAKDAIEDRVRGLDAGADDYLVKPFAFPELSARVRALLRRSKTEPAVVLRIQDLEMDLVSRTVKRAGRTIELTVREFELLEYLLRRQGEVVSREMLGRDVWKEPERPTPLDNVIDVHMVRLRRKIDEGFDSKLVHTVRGVGFTLKTEAP